MTKFNYQKDDTVLLHAGQTADPNTGSLAVPIHQTTSYVFKNADHAANLFALAESGNIYTRIMNPTTDAFEQRVAQLEDGTAALAVASGQAAITYALLNVANSGDEIIADLNLYGGTHNLFAHTLPRLGIKVRFVDATNTDELRAAINDKTRAIFGEAITNPTLNVFDIEKVAEIAHENGLPLIIDNTFAPKFFKPLQWGADVVVHSATKWIGGHGTSIGGVIVDGGRFNWDNPRFTNFTEPDPSYNGICYKDLGAVAFALRARVLLLRDTGAAISPHNAFLLLQGLETLHVRLERHSENAIKVAEFLKDHPAIEWINFPGLDNHPSHELAKKYLKFGYGSIITFGIKGGRDAGRKLIDNIELWSHVANVGDAKSLIIHPATTTHSQLSPEELEESNVSEDLVRLSVGLEDIDNLLNTLDDALSIATGLKAIDTTEENAIDWLLSSPFDRSEGLRGKVIANDNGAATAEEVASLAGRGYTVIDLNDATEEQIDAIYTNEALTNESLNKFANKATIIWSTEAANIDAGEQTIVSGKNIITEANRVRNDRN